MTVTSPDPGGGGDGGQRDGQERSGRLPAEQEAHREAEEREGGHEEHGRGPELAHRGRHHAGDPAVHLRTRAHGRETGKHPEEEGEAPVDRAKGLGAHHARRGKSGEGQHGDPARLDAV
jgi:hypothetical protein